MKNKHLIKILFIHQSAELYGSDKVLLNIVDGLNKNIFYPIILLPEDGPLKIELEHRNLETHVAQVFKISRNLYRLSIFLYLPQLLYQSVKSIDHVVQKRKIDIVHSNTLAVLGGALWARFYNIPHIWHIHEIITHPYFAKIGFAFFARFLSDWAVCNSNATKSWLVNLNRGIQKKSSVIWNGIDRFPELNHSEVVAFRKFLGLEKNEILITLAGRINQWKGHTLLIEAAERLQLMGCENFKILFVGSTATGQQHLQEALLNRINCSTIKDRVLVRAFTEKMNLIWKATDIAVVPSIEPEPFGMVAIEAMASEKPVVAAAHGGLLDIVVDGQTGCLFKPNDKTALCDAILLLLNDNNMRIRMGRQGKKRQEKYFTSKSQVEKFSSFYTSFIKK